MPHSRRPVPPSTTSSVSSHSRVIDVIAALSCIGLALWVYRRALSGFFSPDDLVLLEWARGIAPGPSTLWRYLSGHLYFSLVVPVFGTNPAPYLLVNWLLHGLNVGLAYALVRRVGDGSLAATLAAGLFGSSRLFLTVVGQAVGVGDLLALGLTLATCIALTFPSRGAQMLCTLAFALALLAKETVALLPLAMLAVPAIGVSFVLRVRRLAPVLVVSFVWLGYLTLAGVRGSVLGGSAYATAFGGNLIASVLMFAQWSVDLWSTAPDFRAEVPGLHWWGGLFVVLVIAVIAVVEQRRAKLPPTGVLWWLLGLAPVLPLVRQKHLHYLYAPAVGLAIWIGGALELLLARLFRSGGASSQRRTASRWLAAWGAVAALLLAYALTSDVLMRRRCDVQLADVDLPADTFLRKGEVIRRVSTNVGVALGERNASVLFYNPQIRGGSDFYTNLLPAVLDQGRGLRALHPNIDSVVFVSRWTPAYSAFEIFVANEDGRVLQIGRGPGANLALVRTLANNGYSHEAAELLAASLAAYPGDPDLQNAVARFGDRGK